MRLGKIFLLASFFLYSCGNGSEVSQPVIAIEDIVTPLPDGEEDNIGYQEEITPVIQALRWYPKNIWQSSWSDSVISKVEELGLSEQEVDLSDLLALNCLGYTMASAKQRRFFWLTLVASVASEESAFNPKTRYYERSLGEWSEGLMQLSISNQWHGEECNELDRFSILDPHTNLKCGVRILSNQLRGGRRRMANRIFPTSSYYWSTLTTPSKKNKVIAFFKQHLKELPFCSDS